MYVCTYYVRIDNNYNYDVSTKLRAKNNVSKLVGHLSYLIGHLYINFGVTIKVLSSLFGACIVSNDGIGVVSLTYSIWLVYKISIMRTFIFCHTVHGQSANFSLINYFCQLP